MENPAVAHARERLSRWLEDGRELLALLPEVLDSGQKTAAKLEHAERDAERLRRELMELRKELSEAKDRAQSNEAERQLEDYRRQLEELRRANEQLKNEKDEVALKLIARYVPGKVMSPADVKTWVTENRKWLFFTDVGGFRWMVDEHAKKDAQK